MLRRGLERFPSLQKQGHEIWQGLHRRIPNAPMYVKDSPDALFARRWLEHGVAGPQKVLEIGAGRSYITSTLTNRNLMVFSTEPSETGHYPHKVPFTRVRAPSHVVPWPDGTFNKIFGAYFFEYVEEKEKTLAEMKRVMADGGKALLLFHTRRSSYAVDARAWVEDLAEKLKVLEKIKQSKYSNDDQVRRDFKRPNWADPKSHEKSGEILVRYNQIWRSGNPALMLQIQEEESKLRQMFEDYSYIHHSIQNGFGSEAEAAKYFNDRGFKVEEAKTIRKGGQEICYAVTLSKQQ